MLSSPYDYSGLTGFPANGGDFAALFGAAGQAHGAQFLQWEPGLAGYVFSPSRPSPRCGPARATGRACRPPRTCTTTASPSRRASRIPVPLPVGWNQIGDPYPIPIPVSALTDGAGHAHHVQSRASADPVPLRHGSGTYVALSRADSLQPYVGYWIFAQGGHVGVLTPAAPGRT